MEEHADTVLEAHVVALAEGERVELTDEVSDILCRVLILPFAEFDEVYDTVFVILADPENDPLDDLVTDPDTFELTDVETDPDVDCVTVDLLLDEGDMDPDLERSGEDETDTDLEDDTLGVIVLLYVFHEESDIKGLSVEIYDGLLDRLRLPVEEYVGVIDSFGDTDTVTV